MIGKEAIAPLVKVTFPKVPKSRGMRESKESVDSKELTAVLCAEGRDNEEWEFVVECRVNGAIDSSFGSDAIKGEFKESRIVDYFMV